MPDPDQSQDAPVPSPWSFDPTAGAAPAAKPYSLDLGPMFTLPPSYFMNPDANGTLPGAGAPFAGQYDGPAPGGGGGGNPLDAAAGNIDGTMQHPGGSPFGLNFGDKSLQYAPQGGILPGLFDKFQFKPYIEGMPGMGPPGMPAPWDPGH